MLNPHKHLPKLPLLHKMLLDRLYISHRTIIYHQHGFRVEIISIQVFAGFRVLRFQSLGVAVRKKQGISLPPPYGKYRWALTLQ